MCNLHVPFGSIWLCCQATVTNCPFISSPLSSWTWTPSERVVNLKRDPKFSCFAGAMVNYLSRWEPDPDPTVRICFTPEKACWEQFDGVQPLRTARHAAGRADKWLLRQDTRLKSVKQSILREQNIMLKSTYSWSCTFPAALFGLSVEMKKNVGKTLG